MLGQDNFEPSLNQTGIDQAEDHLSNFRSVKVLYVTKQMRNYHHRHPLTDDNYYHGNGHTSWRSRKSFRRQFSPD